MQQIQDNVENIHPTRKKPIFPVQESLRGYLKKYGREVKLPADYSDLLQFRYAVPLLDKSGKDTHWEIVKYDMREWVYLRESLVKMYAILKTEGDLSFINHLDVARIDFCSFGNIGRPTTTSHQGQDTESKPGK